MLAQFQHQKRSHKIDVPSKTAKVRSEETEVFERLAKKLFNPVGQLTTARASQALDANPKATLERSEYGK